MTHVAGLDESCNRPMAKSAALAEIEGSEDLSSAGVRHADGTSLGMKAFKMSGQTHSD